MSKHQSKNYVTTLDPMSSVDMEKLQTIKDTVKACNAYELKKKRVCLRGRLGKNNPNAWKYKHRCGWHGRSNGYQMIRLADARYWDVYVYDDV